MLFCLNGLNLIFIQISVFLLFMSAGHLLFQILDHKVRGIYIGGTFNVPALSILVFSTLALTKFHPQQSLNHFLLVLNIIYVDRL